MIEVENVSVLLISESDILYITDDGSDFTLTPDAEEQALFSDVVIFGDQLLKNCLVI